MGGLDSPERILGSRVGFGMQLVFLYTGLPLASKPTTLLSGGGVVVSRGSSRLKSFGISAALLLVDGTVR